jgi:hypothetical protein
MDLCGVENYHAGTGLSVYVTIRFSLAAFPLFAPSPSIGVESAWQNGRLAVRQVKTDGAPSCSTDCCSFRRTPTANRLQS